MAPTSSLKCILDRFLQGKQSWPFSMMLKNVGFSSSFFVNRKTKTHKKANASRKQINLAMFCSELCCCNPMVMPTKNKIWLAVSFPSKRLIQTIQLFYFLVKHYMECVHLCFS